MTVDQFIIGFLVVLVTAAVFLVVLGVSMWVRDSIQERQERALFAAYSTPQATRVARCVASPAHRPPGATEISHEWLTAPPQTSPARRALPISPVMDRPWPGAYDPSSAAMVAGEIPAPVGSPHETAALGAQTGAGIGAEPPAAPVPAPAPDGFGATYAYVRAIQELTTEDYLASLARPWAEDTGAFEAVTTGWS